ncbi:MAG: PorT family protein [Saprospiraceae bacterium]|nr:PorT family protein [Saprospiraceae bacterium]
MNRFDQHIRNRLYDLETEIPAHMWSNVSDELTKKKDRKWFFFWILAAGIGSLALYYTQSNRTELFKSAQKQKWMANSEAEKLIGEPTTLIPAEDQGIISDSKVLASLNPVSHQSGDLVNEAAPVEGSHIRQVEKSRNGLATVDRHLNQAAAIKISSIKYHNEKSSGLESGEIFGLEREAAQKSRSHDIISELASRKLGRVESLASLEQEPKIQACPSFTAIGTIQPFVEMNLHTGYPIRSMTLKDPELAPYRDIRKESERIKTMVAAEALVGIRFQGKLEVKSGFSLRRLHEVFDFSDPNASRTIVNIITDTIYNNGTPIIRTDTSVVTEYGQRIKLSNNRYTFLDLPILGGYAFNIKQHRFWVHAGVALNFAFWKRGDLLSPDQQIVSIDSNDPNRYKLFKSTTGLDVLGSVSYEIDLNTNQTVHLRANFRYPLQDLTLDNYPIDQRYKQVSIGLAWRQNF